MAICMSAVAERNGIEFKGAQMAIGIDIAPEPARRIGVLNLCVTLPEAAPEGERAKLAKAAELCHVRNSLRPEVQVNVTVKSPEK